MPGFSKTNTIRVSIGLAAAALIPGCIGDLATNTSYGFRDAALSLHQEQLLDNLRRMKEGLPFLHLEFSQLTATAKLVHKGDIGYTHADPVGADFTDTYTLGITGTQEQGITIAAKPISGKRDLYSLYADIALNPIYFASCSRSKWETVKDNSAHPTLRIVSGSDPDVIYYVTDKGRSIFRDLVLEAAQGSEKSAKKQIINRMVLSVGEPDDVGPNQYAMKITLDRPLDERSGSLLVTLPGEITRRFEFVPVPNDKTKIIMTYSRQNKHLGHDIDPHVLRNGMIGAEIRIDQGVFIRPVSDNFEALNDTLLRLQLQDID